LMVLDTLPPAWVHRIGYISTSCLHQRIALRADSWVVWCFEAASSMWSLRLVLHRSLAHSFMLVSIW
jgi:hypothetical protein